MSRQMNSEGKDMVYTATKNMSKVTRHVILLLVLLTLINISISFSESNTNFLFSLTVPSLAVAIANAGDYKPLFMVGTLVAGGFLVAYMLCWWFSKKHYKWLIVALILYVVDTVVLVAFYLYAQLLKEISSILDIAIHVWVIVILAVGIKYAVRSKKRPAEKALQPDGNSVPLRAADINVRFRILLETDFENYHIVYRRVGRVNELIIDGNVYDEVKMLVEIAHSMEAQLNGHFVSVGYDGNSNSFCIVDGRLVAQKRRII